MGVFFNKDTSETDNIDKIESKKRLKASYEVKKLYTKNYLEIDNLTQKVEQISDKIKIT
jgi:hypothetical protein